MKHLKKMLFVVISTIFICSCSGDKDVLNAENANDDLFMVGLKPIIHSSSTKILTKSDKIIKEYYIVKILKDKENYAYCISDDLENLRFKARKDDNITVYISFIEDFAKNHRICNDNTINLRYDRFETFGPYCMADYTVSIPLNEVQYSTEESFPYIDADVMRMEDSDNCFFEMKRYYGVANVTIVDEKTIVPIDVYLWGFGFSAEILNLDEGEVEVEIINEKFRMADYSYKFLLTPKNKETTKFLSMDGLREITKDKEYANDYRVKIIWKRENREDIEVCNEVYSFKRMYLKKFKVNLIKDYNSGFIFKFESKDYKGEDVVNIN